MTKYLILIAICINFSCFNKQNTKTYSKCTYHMKDFIDVLSVNKIHKLKKYNNYYQYLDTLNKVSIFSYEFNNDSILTKFVYLKNNEEYYTEVYDDSGNPISKKGNPIDIFIYKNLDNEFLLYIISFTINNEYLNFNLKTNMYTNDYIPKFKEEKNWPKIKYSKSYLYKFSDEDIKYFKINYKYDLVCHCDSTIQSISDSLSYTE